jgi:hypothetical protein
MGNCFSQKNKDPYEQSLLISKKTCPYCNHIFNSKKECKKHIKNCLYNRSYNSNIYDMQSYQSIY